MIITTLGRPGSGKTTASKRLARLLELNYVGAGDVARELAETDDETRLELAAGRIAPPGKMRAAMLDKIKPYTILDGYPRYMEQLADLYYQARPSSTSLINIVFLCGPNEAASRLWKRGRSDDTTTQIHQRLENYRLQTLPVVNYLITNHTDSTVTVPQQNTALDSANVAYNYIKDNWA